VSDLAGALRGVRVLDLSRLLPGPFASLVLADLGAQVDKVEEVSGGDYVRHMPPLVPPAVADDAAAGDQSAFFLALNRGKRSIALDLKKKSAVSALLRMVPRYDVLLEQFRPGVLARLGLSSEALRERNPKLIVCALTGYGQDGPLAQRAGHDIDYLARAGVLGQQGPAAGPPQIPGFQLADVGGGLWSVVGILAALAKRDKTGEGATLSRGQEPLAGGLAGYAVYATKDGRAVALGALEPKFWMTFCAAVGLPVDGSSMVPGPHQPEVQERVKAIFLSRTRAEWEAFGREHDVCLEPVLDPSELAGDAHHVARKAFIDVDSPWGVLKQLRLPTTSRDASFAAPPKLGQHTEEILREAGLRQEEITAMKAEGAAR
jgi:crotonobetainyl-CoA:carnitine CoA-transferase CaiB-like acyl-CoA transferase